MTVRRQAILCLAGLVLFALLMHWPVFLQGKTVSAFDLSYFTFLAYRGQRPADIERPSNYLFSDPVLLFNVWDLAMYDGPLERPWLWNPYTAFGSPLLANAQSAPLFPLKAIAYGPAGVRRGFGFLCFLKMLLAGLFMWAYMRALGAGAIGRTLGALAFMACGFMVAWLQWALTSVALFLPLVLLGCEHLTRRKLRSGFLLISVATVFGFLGGHPETSFHLAVAAGVYLVARLVLGSPRSGEDRPASLRSGLTSVGVFVGGVLVGALVSGVQLVPTVESIRLSALAEERADDGPARRRGVTGFLGDPGRVHHEVMTYLVPNTWGNPSLHSHWWGKYSNYNESAAYAGIGVTLLAVFAWRYCARDRRILVLCLLQLLSLGFILKLPLVLDTVGRLPLFDIAANKRFLLVFCLANAAMAGLALDHLLAARKLSRVGLVWLAIIVAAFTALVVRDHVLRFASNPHDWIRAYGRRQLAHFVVFLVPWVVVLFLWRMKALLRTIVAAGLLVLVAADVTLIYFGYNPFVRPDLIYPTTPAVEFLRAQPGPVRALPLEGEIGPNVMTLYGLEDPRIYDAVVYVPCAELLKRLGADGPWHVVEEPNTRLCSIAGVRFIYARPEWSAPPSAKLELVYEDELSKIYENGDALPLAYVSRGWQEVASPEEAYDLLAQADFPWQTRVAVEAAGGARVARPPDEDARPHVAAPIVARHPHEVVVELPADAGLLVLSDTFYPGWKAFVDGEPRPIHRVNGTFRGVFVEAGDRKVVFRYAPASFRWGVVLSLVGVAALLGVVLSGSAGLVARSRVNGRRA